VIVIHRAARDRNRGDLYAPNGKRSARDRAPVTFRLESDAKRAHSGGVPTERDGNEGEIDAICAGVDVIRADRAGGRSRRRAGARK